VAREPNCSWAGYITTGEQVGAANIEIVQQLYKAFAERNIPEILDMLTSDVEWSGVE
jgi:hypothetical protein